MTTMVIQFPRPAVIRGFVVLAAAAGISICAANAHDAPSGWAYDSSCCSSMDCRPVEPGEILSPPRGYRVAPTGEVIPFTDKKVRPSGDGSMHRCMVGGETDKPTICIYVPGGA